MNAKENKLTVLTNEETLKRDGLILKRVVKFGDKKFKLTYANENGVPCGFDSRFKIEIMTTEGTWNTIAGKQDIGFVNVNYISSDLRKNCLEFVKKAEKYIQTIY